MKYSQGVVIATRVFVNIFENFRAFYRENFPESFAKSFQSPAFKRYVVHEQTLCKL